MAMVQPNPSKKKQPRAQRASKRKLNLAAFELLLELKEKKKEPWTGCMGQGPRRLLVGG